MNDTLDTAKKLDLKQDFNIAVKLSGEKYTYVELIEFLSSGKDVEKQLAALELNEIRSKQDASVLVSNLVGQDGKIREVIAFKINEFIKKEEYVNFFTGEEFFEIFLQGIMDINGNICRMVVELTSIDGFKKYLANKLPERITEILEQIEKLEKNEKQYKISKRNFQLYWCLEALYNIIDVVDVEKIQQIIFQAGEFEDYTIREKIAKILAGIDSPVFEILKKSLKNDSNYYVRRYLAVD